MKRALPYSKEDRIYLAIKEYSTYVVEKRIGGLTILDKRDDKIKEKPDSSDFYHRLDELEKKWGKEHLVVENNELIINSENNQSIARIMIENEKERAFLKSFFGI
jgi:hypothetical protein